MRYVHQVKRSTTRRTESKGEEAMARAVPAKSGSSSRILQALQVPMVELGNFPVSDPNHIQAMKSLRTWSAKYPSVVDQLYLFKSTRKNDNFGLKRLVARQTIPFLKYR